MDEALLPDELREVLGALLLLLTEGILLEPQKKKETRKAHTA